MGSPFSAALLRRAAADYRKNGPVRQLYASHPGLEPLPRAGIRLLAALHASALDGCAPALAAHVPSCGGDGDADEAWNASRALIGASRDRIARLYERTPQTNEVARSMPLLCGLLRIAGAHRLPIRLFEIGASAGLNARLDTYRYEGNGWAWGDERSPLVLRNREVSGKPSSLDAPLRVVQRSACDAHPLDVSREEDRRYLRSFIWADQSERLERFDRACEAAMRVPLVVERSDALPWLEERFAAEPSSVAVLMHSMLFYYLTRRQREALDTFVRARAREASADAPLAWLRLENDEYVTKATLWPGGREIRIARSDGHGQDLEWLAP